MERIVVGVDGSGGSRQALHWAVREARLRDAEIDVVHAWHSPYLGTSELTGSLIDPHLIEKAAADILEESIEAVDTTGVKLNSVLAQGSAEHALLEAAKGADLLVVGSRGLGGLGAVLLGSVSYKLAHRTQCPLVIIPEATDAGR